MGGWFVAGATLLASVAFAASSALKHRSAATTPDARAMNPRALARLISSTVRHRLWLLGIGADVIGLSLQVVALHFGALALVQPLLVSSLLFALLLRGHLRRREIAWGLVLTAALAGFVVLSGTVSSPVSGALPDRAPALTAGLLGVAVVAVLVWLGRATRHGPRAGPMFGLAVGVIYAATAALLKAVSDIAAAHGVLAILGAWQFYLLIVCGAVGVLLNQLAFQAGPLSASLPAIATIDPLLSIVIGVVIYDEHIRRGPLSGPGLIVLLVLLVVSVVQLTRSPRPSSASSVRADDATHQVGGRVRP